MGNVGNLGSQEPRFTNNNLNDVEKQATSHLSTPSSLLRTPASPSYLSHLQKWNTRIKSLSGLETRGITRVLPSERQTPSSAAYLQIVILWFGANITVNNLIAGLYGPLLFQLRSRDPSGVGGRVQNLYRRTTHSDICASGQFGNFCAVILALGLMPNSIPGTYSAALNCQMMGRSWSFIPRWIWTVALVSVQLVCALAGRHTVFVVFQNFLALMGYWLTIMICIVAEEHVLFQMARGIVRDWAGWEDKQKLPLGVAALVAFLLGWMGAILGMYQVWYVGPIAKLAADTGADVGMWVG
ncbi:hypothetical protein P171DRAFT_469870 [Karstenula rhodostoma CBS 690.94]|uniref:Uncharacterized protein n=1 Tax=Karstenula rhodostoma CBS 690.94 TaxID=1392251 RepID=A0A9P4PRI2_9PLEO|nr:hypothetical protein P171DRAFT_469870 [Karstenula rhodostoma CBS 690.94]